MMSESFPALDAIPGVQAAFSCRVSGLDVSVEREEALERLKWPHLQARRQAGLDGMVFATAQQVHGNRVIQVSPGSTFPVPDAVGLLTTIPGVCLGIYVALCSATGASPSDLVAQVSPCIRPPHYEIDFASEIVRQLTGLGIRDINDCTICTASNPEKYYSYRAEKGRTGRMLAMLALS